MRSFKPVQIFTLLFFILLMSGFVAFKAGVFDRTGINSANMNEKELFDPIKMRFPIDTPTTKVDTPKINPNLLPSSKSLIIYDKYTIQRSQLDQEIEIADSMRNALQTSKSDSLKQEISTQPNFMGTSKSGVIFTPKSDPFNIKQDSIEH